MKHSAALIFLFLPFLSFAQLQADTIIKISGKDTIVIIKPFPAVIKNGINFTYVEQMPECPYNFNKYFFQNFKYPQDLRELPDIFLIRFLVLKTGAIDSITILKPEEETIKQEILRVVKHMPPWKPGKNKGEPVNVWFVTRIQVCLQ